MLTIHTTEQPLREAATALNQALAKERGKDILLLLSGGSSLALVDHIDTKLLSPRATISLTDERYTFEEQDSNFAQLTALPGWEAVVKSGVQSIDTRPHPAESLEDTAYRLDLAMKQWHLTHQEGVVIATVGIGPDGHTIGILPFPEDEALFTSLFCSANHCVRGYRTNPSKNPHNARITLTITYLKRHVTHAISYVVGEEKRAALIGMQQEGSLASLPARVIPTLPDAQLYTNVQRT